MSTSFDSEFESFDSGVQNDRSEKSPSGHGNGYGETTQDYITKKENDDEVMKSIDNINELLGWNDQLSKEINLKFHDLEHINKDVENDLIKFQKQVNRVNQKQQLLKEPSYITKQKKSYLPTPEDEEYMEKKLEFEIGSISIQNQSTPNLQDLPSSPETRSIISNDHEFEEVEIELNDKISRLVSRNYEDQNVQKLRNIVGSTFELLRFENNEEMKLMNLNDDLKIKSDGLINKLYGLVDSFT